MIKFSHLKRNGIFHTKKISSRVRRSSNSSSSAFAVRQGDPGSIPGSAPLLLEIPLLSSSSEDIGSGPQRFIPYVINSISIKIQSIIKSGIKPPNL